MFAEGDMGQGFWDSVRLLSWAQPLYKKYFFSRICIGPWLDTFYKMILVVTKSGFVRMDIRNITKKLS